MAGLLVGAGGPAGLRGVAPAATVLPIRVAGWQPDRAAATRLRPHRPAARRARARGRPERRRRRARRGAGSRSIPLVEPFAAFSDGPLARAVAGALRLDTLVVAAAGNDGPAGPAFGSIGGPAGAPAALAVGALDAQAGPPPRCASSSARG